MLWPQARVASLRQDAVLVRTPPRLELGASALERSRPERRAPSGPNQGSRTPLVGEDTGPACPLVEEIRALNWTNPVRDHKRPGLSGRSRCPEPESASALSRAEAPTLGHPSNVAHKLCTLPPPLSTDQLRGACLVEGSSARRERDPAQCRDPPSTHPRIEGAFKESHSISGPFSVRRTRARRAWAAFTNSEWQLAAVAADIACLLRPLPPYETRRSSQTPRAL